MTLSRANPHHTHFRPNPVLSGSEAESSAVLSGSKERGPGSAERRNQLLGLGLGVGAWGAATGVPKGRRTGRHAGVRRDAGNRARGAEVWTPGLERLGVPRRARAEDERHERCALRLAGRGACAPLDSRDAAPATPPVPALHAPRRGRHAFSGARPGGPAGALGGRPGDVRRGAGAAPDGTPDAWLVTDARAELIAEIRRLASPGLRAGGRIVPARRAASASVPGGAHLASHRRLPHLGVGHPRRLGAGVSPVPPLGRRCRSDVRRRGVLEPAHLVRRPGGRPRLGGGGQPGGRAAEGAAPGPRAHRPFDSPRDAPGTPALLRGVRAAGAGVPAADLSGYPSPGPARRR
jgi:hypothetical protein